jgi:hypothetical protein
VPVAKSLPAIENASPADTALADSRKSRRFIASPSDPKYSL